MSTGTGMTIDLHDEMTRRTYEQGHAAGRAEGRVADRADMYEEGLQDGREECAVHHADMFSFEDGQAACAETHMRLIRHARCQGQDDKYDAIRRSYRAGQLHGSTVLGLAFIGLGMVAGWLRGRGR